MNVDAINPNISRRIDSLIEQIKLNKWDLISIQELVLPSVKERIHQKLADEYYVLFTDHSKNDLVFPLVSYLPTLLFLSLSTLASFPAVANFVLLTLAFVLLPQTFVFIAEKVVYLNQKSKLKLWSYGTGYH